MKQNLKFICPNRYQCVLKITLILSFVIFSQVYIDVLNQFIVLPILAGINDNDPLTSIGVLFAWILSICYYLHRYQKEKPLKMTRVINGLTISVAYLVCRFEGPWHFYRFSFLPAIAYTDILLVAFLAEIFKWSTSLFAKKPPVENERSFPFYSDTAAFEDDYDRGPLADLLIQRLKSTFSSFSMSKDKDAFTVGICGPWGSGKTSFLNLLKERMEKLKKQHHDIIYFEYQPWLCRNEKDILTEFFNSLKENLARYNRSISGQTDDYLNKLIQVDTSGFARYIPLATHLFKDDQTAFSEYKNLKESIRTINKPIFIYLDNLDRLNEEELFETIKIIRNTANFQNLFFILAYDKEHLLGTINRKYSYPEMYLEKIINTEIVFPAFEDAVIINELKNQLKTAWLNLCKEEKHKERWEEIERNIFNDPDFLLRYFRNFRDVKRFTNSFSISAAILLKKIECNEIYWPDFILLEILKVKYQDIYNILKDNPTSILVGKETNYILEKERFKGPINLLEKYDSEMQIGRKFARLRNKEDKNRQSRRDMGPEKQLHEDENPNGNHEKEPIENSDFILSLIKADQMKKGAGCLKLLEQLFPQTPRMTQVAHIQSFYKYFSYRLRKGEISINELIAIIYQEDQLEERLNDLIDNNLVDLRNKFHTIIQEHSAYSFSLILKAVFTYFTLLLRKFPNITEKYSLSHLLPFWHFLFCRTDENGKELNERDKENRVTIFKEFKDVDYNSIQWGLLAELLKNSNTQKDIDKLILSIDDITYLIGRIVLKKEGNQYFLVKEFLKDHPNISTGIFHLLSHYIEGSFAYKFRHFVDYSKEHASVSIEGDETGFLEAYEAYTTM